MCIYILAHSSFAGLKVSVGPEGTDTASIASRTLDILSLKDFPPAIFLEFKGH